MTTSTDPIEAARFRPPREQPDSRVRTWWLGHGVLWTGATVAVLVVLAVLLPATVSGWLVVAAVAVGVAGAAAAVLLPPVWYRRHRWEVTDVAVYTRSGLLRVEWRAAPLSRIQTVDTTSGPWQQRLGIADLVVTTASAKGAVRVVGLDAEAATVIADDLTRRTHTVSGDAT